MPSYMFPNYLSEAEQAEVEAFIKGPAPEARVRRDYGLIEANYWNRLRLLLGKTKAPVKFQNLFIAHLALVEEDRAVAREQERKQRVFADVEVALASIPDFNKGDDHNVHAAESFFNQNPSATAQDFINDISLHPDRYHFYSGPKKPDLVAILHKDASLAMRQVLVSTYGQDAVDEAWNTITKSFRKGSSNADKGLRHEGLKTVAEQNQEAKAAQNKRESDPREIERARARVEALIDGVRVSNNHADNYRVKAHLRGLESSFHKPETADTDWFRYEEAIKVYLDSQTSTSIR